MATLRQRLSEAFTPQRYVKELRDAREEAFSERLRADSLLESHRELSLYLEDLGWTKLEGWEAGDTGISLAALERTVEKTQALLGINPTIKKAVNARVGYIWGRGVKINIGNASAKKRVIDNNPRNQSTFFSEHAYWSLEAALATHGNLWAMRNKRTNDITLVPLEHIGGWSEDADDPSRANYWLIDYVRTTTNYNTGQTQEEQVTYWVPAHDAPLSTSRRIGDTPINRNFEMIHLAVNRQAGWVLGTPDLIASMLWAKNHKELFEAGSTFMKAQGKFAAKVVAKTEAGGRAAAASVRDTPRQDPTTGEVYAYGGTAIATGGLDYQLMGKMTGGVDFASFDPVGALVAAGLGIPLDVLMAKSPSPDISLEQTTVAEMQQRQKLWSWFYTALLGGPRAEVSVVWPKIRTEPEYRRIQSVEIANKTNVLHRTELRQLTLEGFALDGDPEDLPPMSEQPDVAINRAKGKDDAAQAAKNSDSGATANIDPVGQGRSTNIGKLSDGTDSKDARNNPLDTNVQGQ